MTVRSLRLAFVGDPASVHLRRWLGRFVTRGHTVALLQPTDARPDDLAELPDGVERLPFRPLPLGLGPSGIVAARRDLRQRIAEWQPNVVHAHYARRPAWHAWLSGARPYAVTVWGSDVLVTDRMTLAGRAATLVALRDATLITAGTRRLAAAAVALGARSERVRAVELGVDTQRFHPGPPDAALRQRLGIGDARVVLSPRMLAPLYRHETIIEALALLPPDVVVLSTAMLANGDERARLEHLSATLGVADRWRIVPAVPSDEMVELYRLADAIVSVPESDAMPQSVLEAMAAGRISVLSDLPDAREWLDDLTPELLVPVGDARSTAAALVRVLSMPAAERDVLGTALRHRVIDRADAGRNMDAMEQMYVQLAEGSRP